MSIVVSPQKVYIPPGFRFLPTKEEILNFYLKGAINREPLPRCPLNQREIYGENMEPWKLFNKDEKGPFWVFTKLKRRNKSRIDRVAGCGCWLGQSTKEVKDSFGKLLGFDKSFTFSCKSKGDDISTSSRSNSNGNWIMHEFSLAEKGYNDYVICEIKNKDLDKPEARNKRKSLGEVVDDQEMLPAMKKVCTVEGINELFHQQNHVIPTMINIQSRPSSVLHCPQDNYPSDECYQQQEVSNRRFPQSSKSSLEHVVSTNGLDVNPNGTKESEEEDDFGEIDQLLGLPTMKKVCSTVEGINELYHDQQNHVIPTMTIRSNPSSSVVLQVPQDNYLSDECYQQQQVSNRRFPQSSLEHVVSTNGLDVNPNGTKESEEEDDFGEIDQLLGLPSMKKVCSTVEGINELYRDQQNHVIPTMTIHSNPSSSVVLQVPQDNYLSDECYQQEEVSNGWFHKSSTSLEDVISTNGLDVNPNGTMVREEDNDFDEIAQLLGI